MKKCNHESCNQEHSSTTSLQKNKTSSMFNSSKEHSNDTFFQKNETPNYHASFGTGIPSQAVAFGQSLNLHGLTEANFNQSFSFSTEPHTEATECGNCGDSDCKQVKGLLSSQFQVDTRVTLPSVSDYDLTPCQIPIVSNAINNVLAPHEQDHVRRFSTYNGTVGTPFNIKVCSADLDAKMQEMHDGIATARQTAAQALSDAIDPFNFNVDIDCED